MGVEKDIADKIKSKKVMVIAKSTCPYSIKAKKVFENYINSDKLRKEDYGVWDIDFERNMDAIQEELGKMTGAKSVCVFILVVYISAR